MSKKAAESHSRGPLSATVVPALRAQTRRFCVAFAPLWFTTRTHLPLARRLLLVVAGAVASGLLSGCGDAVNKLHQASPSEAAAMIEQHSDYYATHLTAGMARDKVLALLPKPANTNTENVCVWVFASTERTQTEDRNDWQWFVSTRGGFFLVFVDGKLATPLCANAAFNPWQALEDYAALNHGRAEAILGPRR